MFYNADSALYNDISFEGYGVVNQIALACKVCVSFFVFLSGYGLMLKAETENKGLSDFQKKIDCKKFYKHRISKLLINYWFIWLVFVPISVFVFNISFSDAYNNEYVALKVLFDFLGVINCVGIYGYNPTWWFMSAIIVLYLAFPLLYKLYYKNTLALIVFAIILYFLHVPYIQSIKIYFLPFVVGMIAYKNERIADKITPPLWFAMSAILFLLRFFVSDTILYDTIIVLTSVIAYTKMNKNKWVEFVLNKIGIYSMDIFLFHTFIFHFWFERYIYISKNPIIIFISLLVSCLVIAYILDIIKYCFGFKSLLRNF